MLIRYWMMKPPRGASRFHRGRGGFIYIIRNGFGHHKIGISSNPNTRVADLRTASPVRLDIVYAAALDCSGFSIEEAAHDILARYRLQGEWFNCPLEVAVAAIGAAACRLGEPFAAIDPSRIDEIVDGVSWERPRSIKSALAWCYIIIVIGMIGAAIAAAFIMGTT